MNVGINRSLWFAQDVYWRHYSANVYDVWFFISRFIPSNVSGCKNLGKYINTLFVVHSVGLAIIYLLVSYIGHCEAFKTFFFLYKDFYLNCGW